MTGHFTLSFMSAAFLTASLWPGAGLAEDKASGSTPTDSQFSLTLNIDEALCTVSVSKQDSEAYKIPLLLESPCFWVSTGEPAVMQQYSYPEHNTSSTFLVAGTKLDWSDEKKEYQKLPTDQTCGQFLQGIVISEDEVLAVDGRMEAPHCQGQAVDEKVFRQAASTDKRYKEEPTSLNLKDLHAVATQQNPRQAPSSEKAPTFFESIQKSIKGLFSAGDEE